MERGCGGDRDPWLRDHNVTTWLILRAKEPVVKELVRIEEEGLSKELRLMGVGCGGDATSKKKELDAYLARAIDAR